jgi:hypothetical protein
MAGFSRSKKLPGNRGRAGVVLVGKACSNLPIDKAIPDSDAENKR